MVSYRSNLPLPLYLFPLICVVICSLLTALFLLKMPHNQQGWNELCIY